MRGQRTAPVGFTLIEVLLGAGLTLLLLDLLICVLLPAMQAAARGPAKVELAEQAMVVMSSLSGDLQTTSPRGVAVDEGPAYTRVSIQPRVSVLGSAALVWATSLDVYAFDAGSRCVTRTQWTAPGPPSLAVTSSAPYPAGPADLASIVAAALPSRTLALGVDGLSVAPQGQGVQVTVNLTAPGVGNQAPTQLQLSRIIGLRNRD